MTANGKIRILINTDFESSGVFCPDTFCVADVVVRTLESRHYTVVDICLVVPSDSADELLLGILAGQTEISFAEISTGPDADREHDS